MYAIHFSRSQEKTKNKLCGCCHVAVPGVQPGDKHRTRRESLTQCRTIILQDRREPVPAADQSAENAVGPPAGQKVRRIVTDPGQTVGVSRA